MAFFMVNVLIRNGDLADLRGAPLSCLMALAAHAGNGKKPYPSVECLCEETGFSRHTVCSAMAVLEAKGHIKTHSRYHNSNEYEITSCLFERGKHSAKNALSSSHSAENALSDESHSAEFASHSANSGQVIVQNLAHKEETIEEDPDPEVPSADVVSRETPSATGTHAYSADFDAFWAVYPNKLEKRQGWKCWQTRLKEGHEAADMIEAARNYAAYCTSQNTEMRYIKHAPTFLGPSKPFEDWLHPPPVLLQRRETNTDRLIKLQAKFEAIDKADEEAKRIEQCRNE